MIVTYNKGKCPGRKRSPYIQKCCRPIHAKSFEAIKSLIVKAPLPHLPSMNSKFYLECDLCAKFISNSKWTQTCHSIL